MTYRILVTGTRETLTPRSEREVIYALRVAAAGRTDILVVHGACPTGVDAFVDGLCYEMGVAVERHRADWAAHGRSAGPKRNAHMVSLGADVCLAFPHGASRGTRGCAMLAERAGIPTTVVEL